MINLDLSIAVTILYIIILYVFMNRLFFGPITRILHERRQLIDGRLEEAQKRMAIAERKTAEHEEAIRSARVEIYRQQEQIRDRALAEKADLVTRAKNDAEKAVKEGQAKLRAAGETARAQLAFEVELLSKKLSSTLIRE